MRIGVNHKEPAIAQKIADFFLTELSETLREEVLADARENKRFFEEQLNVTDDALLRDKIYNMLAKEIEKETFAKAQKYYSFVVLDPPIVPEPKYKVKPKRSIICIMSVFAAFFFSVFLAFLLEFTGNVRSEDPEKFNAIANGLKFWKKSFWKTKAENETISSNRS